MIREFISSTGTLILIQFTCKSLLIYYDLEY